VCARVLVCICCVCVCICCVCVVCCTQVLGEQLVSQVHWLHAPLLRCSVVPEKSTRGFVSTDACMCACACCCIYWFTVWSIHFKSAQPISRMQHAKSSLKLHFSSAEPVATSVGLARTRITWCTHGISDREIGKYTVIYGVCVQFWPTLCMYGITSRHTFGHIQCVYAVLANPMCRKQTNAHLRIQN
jgi:hypothetical protein